MVGTIEAYNLWISEAWHSKADCQPVCAFSLFPVSGDARQIESGELRLRYDRLFFVLSDAPRERGDCCVGHRVHNICEGRPWRGLAAAADEEKSLASDPAHPGGCIRGGERERKVDTNRFDKAQQVPLAPRVFDPERRSK